MGRIILYSLLGFVVFTIIGFVIGVLIYGASPATQAPVLVTLVIVAITGTFFSGLFAHWMNIQGEQKLEQFSNRSKMIYGISGVVIGGLVSLSVARFLDHTNSHPGFDLLGITIGTILFGWIMLFIARRLNFSEKPSITFTTIFIALIYFIQYIIKFLDTN